jgi:HK97 family phage prohead protease
MSGPNIRYCATESARAKGAPGDRLWTFTITSGDVDHEGDRVNIDGVDLADFLRNPVALASHDYRSFPIGRWENVRKTGAGFDGRILADLRLAPAGTLAAADTAAALISSGMLRGCSIGFIPLEYVRNEYGGFDHLRCKIIECSVVSVPANPAALLAAAFGARRLADGGTVIVSVRDLQGMPRMLERAIARVLVAKLRAGARGQVARAAVRLATIVREGRTISADTGAQIQAAIEAIEDAAELLESLLGLDDDTTPDEDDPAA